MDLYILDKTFKPIALIDNAASVIWADRYYDTGDFEIYIPASLKNLSILQEEYYVKRMDSDMIGIIEKINLKTDIENGDYLTVSGRDLKSILGRRIIWNQSNLSGKVEMILRQLINENVINPTIAARKIPNVKLGSIKGFTETADFQVTGDNLLDKVIELCKAAEIGWKVTLDEEVQLVIEFYQGTNRSHSQSANPYVVFSPTFDNLLTTETQQDITTYKNAALVAGEGEGSARRTVALGTASGMSRRELYVDARDISSNDGEITSSQYTELLKQRGSEKLAAAVKTLGVSGTAETALTYKLNEDYFLGDTVAVENEYGIKANSKILEVIECEDQNGLSIIPTFEEWRTE